MTFCQIQFVSLSRWTTLRRLIVIGDEETNDGNVFEIVRLFLWASDLGASVSLSMSIGIGSHNMFTSVRVR